MLLALAASLEPFVDSAVVAEQSNLDAGNSGRCRLIRAPQECCHSCKSQSWRHQDHGRTVDQRIFHLPLPFSSRILPSFPSTCFPLLTCFHTANS